MRVKITIVVFTLSLIPGNLFSGTKEEVIRLQSDVLQLQNLVRTLQKDLDRSSGMNQSLLEQLNDQIANSNSLLKELVGAFRSQRNSDQEVASGLRNDIQDVVIKLDDTNNRVAALHRKFEESQARRDSLRLTTPVIGTDPKPDQIYHLSYNDYLTGNYELAITAFREFLTKYPESEFSDNAAFYLAICHQMQGRYEQSIDVLDEVINMYPNSDKAPSAYYKKAMAQLDLQKNEDAIDTFSKLISIHSDSPESQLALQELEKLGIALTEIDSR